NEFLRAIERHPGRFAGLFVAQNFAAKRTLCFLVDLRDPQRGAVGDRGMSIGASEKNRIIRRDFVEIGASRKLRRIPERLDPTAAGYPFSAFGFGDALFYFREKIFERVRSFEIQGQL